MRLKLALVGGSSRVISVSDDSTVGTVFQEAWDLFLGQVQGGQEGDVTQAKAQKTLRLLLMGQGVVEEKQSQVPLLNAGFRNGELVRVEVRQKPFFVRRIIPADNSCLFMAVQYARAKGQDERRLKLRGQEFRKLVAETVGKDEERWNEAVLEMTQAEYAEKIQRDTTWGSFTELLILAEFLEQEFVCIDIKSLQVMEAKPECATFETFSVLLFDGIHWDVFALAESIQDEGSDVTAFPQAEKDKVVLECLNIARELHTARQFTDLSKFSIRCAVCGAGLAGQKGALEHSKATGHFNFTEI